MQNQGLPMTQPAAADIAGIECKHVCYTAAKDGSAHDLLLVKEIVHYKDGTKKLNLRQLIDFKRPFYIDRAAFAPEGSPGTYKDKKEWQDVSKLIRLQSTQVNLPNEIFRALNPGRMPSRHMRLREICRSPYVYGADVTSATLVKRHYIDTWPDYNGSGKYATPLSTCMLDTETDMLGAGKGKGGGGEVIMTSLTMDHRIHLFVLKKFLKRCQDPEKEVRSAMHHYLGEYEVKRGIELSFTLCDDPGEMIVKVFQRLHEWKPDILAIWNMNFDVPKMCRELEKAGFDLGEIWSDPSIPPFFRKFQYREGSNQKVTQSGKTMPIPGFDQWHSVIAPASFQVIDAMCLYRKLRFAKGMENGYGLDDVLERNLGIRKLKFKEADHLTKGQWHAFMQANYPVEYCVYNIFDCVSMQELDEKNGDISRQLNLHAGHSEFTVFPSQPRRTWDDMHFECLAVNRIAATTSDQMRDKLDELTYPLTGWIVTLPSHQVKDTGLKVLEEVPQLPCMIWGHVADLDITGTYPSSQLLANIAKETTVTEMIKIEGLDDATQRSIGVNLTAGHVNAVEIAVKVFKAPTFDMLLSDYLASKGVQANIATDVGWVDSGTGALEEEDDEETALVAD
jgi:hypothetical protein